MSSAVVRMLFKTTSMCCEKANINSGTLCSVICLRKDRKLNQGNKGNLCEKETEADYKITITLCCGSFLANFH